MTGVETLTQRVLFPGEVIHISFPQTKHRLGSGQLVSYGRKGALPVRHDKQMLRLQRLLRGDTPAETRRRYKVLSYLPKHMASAITCLDPLYRLYHVPWNYC